MNYILKAGCNAYLDTLESGLIPCKVLRVYDTREPNPYGMYFELTKGGISSRYRTDIRVTETVRAYKKSEVLTDCAACDVVPRGAIRRRKYSTVIKPYRIEVTTSRQDGSK